MTSPRRIRFAGNISALKAKLSPPQLPELPPPPVENPAINTHPYRLQYSNSELTQNSTINRTASEKSNNDMLDVIDSYARAKSIVSVKSVSSDVSNAPIPMKRIETRVETLKVESRIQNLPLADGDVMDMEQSTAHNNPPVVKRKVFGDYGKLDQTEASRLQRLPEFSEMSKTYVPPRRVPGVVTKNQEPPVQRTITKDSKPMHAVYEDQYFPPPSKPPQAMFEDKILEKKKNIPKLPQLIIPKPPNEVDITQIRLFQKKHDQQSEIKQGGGKANMIWDVAKGGYLVHGDKKNAFDASDAILIQESSLDFGTRTVDDDNSKKGKLRKNRRKGMIKQHLGSITPLTTIILLILLLNMIVFDILVIVGFVRFGNEVGKFKAFLDLVGIGAKGSGR